MKSSMIIAAKRPLIELDLRFIASFLQIGEIIAPEVSFMIGFPNDPDSQRNNDCSMLLVTSLCPESNIYDRSFCSEQNEILIFFQALTFLFYNSHVVVIGLPPA